MLYRIAGYLHSTPIFISQKTRSSHSQKNSSRTQIAMKLSLASIVAFSLTAASHAALPPGYEDDQWCAKGDCSIFINPYGDAGAQVGAGVDFELLSNSLTFECRNPNFQL